MFNLLLMAGMFLAFAFYLIHTKSDLRLPDQWLWLFYLTISPTLVGFIFISNFDDYMSFGMDNLVSSAIKSETLSSYLLSWIVTFLLFSICYKRVKITTEKSARDTSSCMLYICLASFFMLMDIILLPEIPLLKLIINGVEAGIQSRGEMIQYQISNGIPGFNILMRNFPSVVFAWVAWTSIGTRRYSMFVLYSAIYCVYSFALLAKGFMIYPLIFAFWAFSDLRHKKISFVYLLIFIVLLFGVFYFVNEDLEGLSNIMLNRLFIVQAEGAFLIRQYYTEFDLNSLLYGFPLLSFLGIGDGFYDPSVEVIKELFPGVNAWVNINSYYIGQGSVMLGECIWIIGPLFIFFNGMLIKLISKIEFPSLRDGFAYIACTVAIIQMPLNTNFALVLYLKPFFSALIVVSFVYFVNYVKCRLIQN